MEKRFGEDFKGPLIPFGAEIQYKPIAQKDKERLHQFGSKMLSGIFMGYKQKAGGGWSFDLLVADWEEIAAAQTTNDIYAKRLKAGDVQVNSKDTFRFLKR